MSEDALRRLLPDMVGEALDDEVPTNPDVVGVLLAAGTSSRFGTANKLLADLAGDPLVRHAARTLRDARLSAVVVVLGCDAAAVRAALAEPDAGDGSNDPDLRFVTNPDYEAGLSTSVGRGVEAATDLDADAVVFLPGDMPLISPATVDLLVDAFRSGLADAAAAGYDGRRGNPVLFDSRYFPALRGVGGDVGGKGVLLDAERGAVVETDDPGTVDDVDTRGDLERRD